MLKSADSFPLIDDYPHLSTGQIYFNHASCGPISKNVKTALEMLIQNNSSDKINDYLELTSKTADCKKLISEMINCEPDRIAFLDNTTNGINILAHGIEFKKGDRILLNDAEFPGNVYPFLNLQRHGVIVDFVKSDNGIVTAEELLSAVKKETKLISVSQVQFISGYRADLEIIGKYCKENNIIFSVDAIQGLGAVNPDIEKFHIDFLSCGTQKWMLGLQGFAFIFVRKSLQEKLNVAFAGWLGVKNAWNLLDYNLEFRESASRFQGGTINSFGVYAAFESLKLFKKYGYENVEQSVIDNTEYFLQKLIDIGLNPILKDINRKYIAGIVSLKTRNGEQIFNHLNENKIVSSLRENHIRFSPHFYNSHEEIDIVIDILKNNAHHFL